MHFHFKENIFKIWNTECFPLCTKIRKRFIGREKGPLLNGTFKHTDYNYFYNCILITTELSFQSTTSHINTMFSCSSKNVAEGLQASWKACSKIWSYLKTSCWHLNR